MDEHELCPSCFEPTGAADPCPQCGYTAAAEGANLLYLKPGTMLAEKYLIGRVLGQGGFGITYLGWDMNLDVKLAIKEFFPQGLVSRQPGESYIVSFAGTAAEEYNYGIERFLDEAKTLARFEDHPNIVSVRDFFRENKTAYMVMGFVEGITLEKHLENQGGEIPFDKAVEILMPVMDALREVHEVGFLHRDISPDNMVISKKGRVVLIDFGAAREAMRGKSKSMSVILKKGYAPEEQYRSRGQQGPWTDVYAVGATLYRAITGKVPPEAMDRLVEESFVKPSDYGLIIPSDKEQALLKALSVSANNRYQTIAEFQADLLNVGNGNLNKGTDFVSKPKQRSVKPAVYEHTEKNISHVQSKKEEFSKQKNNVEADERIFDSSLMKKLKTAAAVIIGGIFLFTLMHLFGGSPENSIFTTEQKDSNSSTQGSNATAIAEPLVFKISEEGQLAQPGEVAKPYLLYGLKEGKATTIYRKNITDGSQEKLFSFTEIAEAELSGNLWKGLPPNFSLSPDQNSIAYIDETGLNIYSYQSRTIKPVIQVLEAGEDTDSMTKWSVESMNEGIMAIYSPLWSAESEYIAFNAAYFMSGSGYGFIRPSANELVGVSISPYGSIVTSNDGNLFLIASRDTYETERGLFMIEPDIDDGFRMIDVVSWQWKTYSHYSLLQQDIEHLIPFYQANFCPNDSSIAFIHSNFGQWDELILATIDSGGGNYNVIAQGDISNMLPFFSPDGQTLYYFKNYDDQPTLSRVNLADGEKKDVVILPSENEYNFWSFLSWTEEGYLVLEAVSGYDSNRRAGERSLLSILNLENNEVVYVSPVFESFTRFAGLLPH